MLFEPARGNPTLVELRPYRSLVFIGHAPVLYDFEAKVWSMVSRIIGAQASVDSPRT